MGGRGSSSGKAANSRGKSDEEAVNRKMEKELSAHFQEVDKKIELFMKAKGYAYSEDYGLPNAYLEKDTIQNMKSLLKSFNNGDNEVADDDAIYILYKGGSIVYGNDVLWDGKKIKLTNIDSVIYDNGSTTMFAGNHIEAYNLRERLPYISKGYNGYKSVADRYNDEDDIRVDFMD